MVPLRRVDGALELWWVGLRLEPDRMHRHTLWTVIGRGGVVREGEFDLPAVSFWRGLAQVERTISAAGIKLHGGTGAS